MADHLSRAAGSVGAISSEGKGPHLPGDDRDFGHGGLSKGVEQLGTMPDDASIFLRCAWVMRKSYQLP